MEPLRLIGKEFKDMWHQKKRENEREKKENKRDRYRGREKEREKERDRERGRERPDVAHLQGKDKLVFYLKRGICLPICFTNVPAVLNIFCVA